MLEHIKNILIFIFSHGNLFFICPAFVYIEGYDPIAILYIKSNLRLVINLQTNVKAMQSPAYARKVKLQQQIDFE